MLSSLAYIKKNHSHTYGKRRLNVSKKKQSLIDG